MPEPAPRPRPFRSRWAVAYWTAAVVLYGVIGALYPPAFLLGFWEAVPALLLVTRIASRLFPRPAPPLPPREQR